MSKLKIRDVARKENSNKYCGASALSVITGLDSSICARILADFDSDVMIKGCSIPRMINAIRNYGLEAKRVLKNLDKGKTVVFISDDPASPIDFSHFSENEGYNISIKSLETGKYYFTLSKI